MHAYLIIAHNNFNQLAQLLSLLDDKRNDIYIHIDKKSPFSEKDKKLLNCSVNHSKVYFVHRITVTWGAYSIVESEMILLKAAVKKGYDYYHLLSGQDLPLKTQDEIHSFFDAHQGKEFVHFGNEEFINSSVYRIKYYWFFSEGTGRSTRIDKRLIKGFSKALVIIQKIIGIDRTKKLGKSFKYAVGAQWFSITDNFARYIVKNSYQIQSMLKNTVCCDEVLVQTLAINSNFYNKCYNNSFNNDYHSIMRDIDWKRGKPYTWQNKDFDELISSEYLFARKFDADIDKDVIKRIIDYILKKNTIVKNNYRNTTASEKDLIKMTQNDKRILDLIFFLLKRSLALPADISVLDLDFVCDTSVIKRIEQILIRHKLVVTVYSSVADLAQNDAGNVLWNTLQTDLKIHNYKYIKQAFDQEYEIGELLDAFENNKLTAIPLKGWELRKLYPYATNRSMVDFDILVKDYDYKKVAKVMKQLEFDCGSESSWKHDNFNKNNVTVEVHKRLTDDSKYIARWEQTLWDRSKPYSKDNEFIRKMCNEDFYIFHFLHMHKHFCNGALGLRTLVDTWLFLNKYKKLNRNYLDTQFERMGLKDFVERIEHLSRACFETNDFDENDLLLLEYAITSGVHGDGKRYKLGRAVMKSKGSLKLGALRSKFDAVFLPYSRMKAQFPILKKYPFLLPYCWFKRIWQFRHSISASAKRVSYTDVSESDFKKMREYFRAAGVN